MLPCCFACPDMSVLLQVTPSSVLATWEAPLDDGGGEVKAYQLRWRQTLPVEDASDDWTEGAERDQCCFEDIQSETVSQLPLDASFEFSVRARNDKGWSGWLEPPVDWVTELPTGKPEEPTVASFSAEWVDFSWNHPSPVEGIVFVDYYVLLSHWDAEAEEWGAWELEVVVSSSVTRHRVYGLSPGANVRLAVAATNTTAGDSGRRRLDDVDLTSLGPISGEVVVTTANDPNLQTVQGDIGAVTSLGTYEPGSSASWLIRGNDEATRISLHITKFELECDHDSLTIHAVNDTGWFEVWSGGCVRPEPFDINVIDVFRVGLTLTSDDNVEVSDSPRLPRCFCQVNLRVLTHAACSARVVALRCHTPVIQIHSAWNCPQSPTMRPAHPLRASACVRVRCAAAARRRGIAPASAAAPGRTAPRKRCALATRCATG